jgi:hypothetical protein
MPMVNLPPACYNLKDEVRSKRSVYGTFPAARSAAYDTARGLAQLGPLGWRSVAAGVA